MLSASPSCPSSTIPPMTQPDDGERSLIIHVPGDMTPQRMYLATSMIEAICILTALTSRIVDPSRNPYSVELELLTNEIEDVTRAIRTVTRTGETTDFKPGKSAQTIAALSDLNLATSRVRLELDSPVPAAYLVHFEWLQSTSSFVAKVGIDINLPVITTARENIGKTGRETRKEELRHLQVSNLQAEQEREMEIVDKRMKMIKKTLSGWVKDGIITVDESRRILRAILSGELAINNAASWLDFALDAGTPPPPAIGPAGD